MERLKALYIYLDDIREMPDNIQHQFQYFTKCVSVDMAQIFVRSALEIGIREIWFDLDHDLGEYARFGGDAIKLVDWLVERYHDLDVKFKFHFHSMNPVGVQNMKNAVEKYWEVY